VKGSALVNAVRQSPNVEPRIDHQKPSLIILHYTAMASAAKAIDWLCTPESKVSCHYLVDTDGTITQMVDEELRAWHAGVSIWHGNVDMNSASIGIEIQNEGHNGGLPEFPDAQIARVIALCHDIMVRHQIAPHCVIGHSDVAPGRKIDPGEAFPWQRLAEAGIGQMVRVTHATSTLTEADVQRVLTDLGYGLDGSPERFKTVLEAFQRHYRCGRIDGVVDAEISSIMQRLLASLPVANRSV
jgi:N-acetylmuramoyl-L-alanine amidase